MNTSQIYKWGFDRKKLLKKYLKAQKAEKQSSNSTPPKSDQSFSELSRVDFDAKSIGTNYNCYSKLKNIDYNEKVKNLLEGVTMQGIFKISLKIHGKVGVEN